MTMYVPIVGAEVTRSHSDNSFYISKKVKSTHVHIIHLPEERHTKVENLHLTREFLCYRAHCNKLISTLDKEF